MYQWEAKLWVRKRAVEFKLNCLRARWCTTSGTRDGVFEGTSSWDYLSERMTGIEQQIDREREELEFVEGLLNVGPIRGGEIALVVRRNSSGEKIDVPKTRSLLNIIDEVKEDFKGDKWEKWESVIVFTDEEAQLIARGLDIAYDIICNPYKYLSEDERAAYDAIDPEVRKAVQPPKRNGGQVGRGAAEDEGVTRTRGGERIMPASRQGPPMDALDDDDDELVVRRR